MWKKIEFQNPSRGGGKGKKKGRYKLKEGKGWKGGLHSSNQKQKGKKGK